MKEAEMETIVGLIDEVISNIGTIDVYKRVATSVEELCRGFPLYPELHGA
jgi:glycine/serine hydroxymethyltransferase